MTSLFLSVFPNQTARYLLSYETNYMQREIAVVFAAQRAHKHENAAKNTWEYRDVYWLYSSINQSAGVQSHKCSCQAKYGVYLKSAGIGTHNALFLFDEVYICMWVPNLQSSKYAASCSFRSDMTATICPITP